MEDVAIISTLTNIDLFDGLEVSQIERIRDTGHRRTLQPGDVLSEPFTTDESLHAFLEGELRIETADGTPLVSVKAPRVLGEMGVLIGEERTSRVVAVQETQLLELSSDELQALVESDHEIGQRLLANLCRTLYDRLHGSNDEIHQLRKGNDELRRRLSELVPDDPLLKD